MSTISDDEYNPFNTYQTRAANAVEALFGERDLDQPIRRGMEAEQQQQQQQPIRRDRRRHRSSSSSASSRRVRRRSSSRHEHRDSEWHQGWQPADPAALPDHPPPAAAAAFSAPPSVVQEAIPEDEERPDEPEVYRSRYVDFNKYEQDPDDPIIQPNFCVFCHVAMSTKQMEMNRLLQSLLDLQKHHRSYMAPLSFCRMQQDDYNENIRPHIVDKYGRRYKDPRGAPAMSAKQFWEHHISHIYSPSVFHEELAREVSSNLLLMLQNGSKLKTRKRGVYVDEDKFWNAARIYDKFKGLLTSVGSGRDTTLYGAK